MKVAPAFSLKLDGSVGRSRTNLMLNSTDPVADGDNAWMADPEQAKAALSDSLLASRELVRRSHAPIALATCPRAAPPNPAND